MNPLPDPTPSSTTPPFTAVEPNPNASPSAQFAQMTAPAAAYAGPAPTEEEKSSTSLMYYLSIILALVLPLVFLLTKKNQPFTQDQAKEGVNYGIGLWVAIVVINIFTLILARIAWPLSLIGTLAGLTIFVINLLWSLKAAKTVQAGQPWRYPFALRLLK